MFYTGKGDKGLTSLFLCPKSASRRIPKNSPRIEALGALDELNSLLGVCKTKSRKPFDKLKVKKIIENIQNDLFIIQGEIAACSEQGRRGAKKPFDKLRVKEIEKEINRLEKKLPKINNFTIAGGTELSALLDYSRAVARRAERRCVAVKQNISPTSLIYLNRLSSFLFALARYVNRGIKEKHPKY
ncbi:MAG: cob(I)yrinic acid a,c-diamide adenosyltransferase [bacterium]